MYYTISTEEKRIDIISPDETTVINHIRIYHDDGRFIKGVSVIADAQLLFEGEKPEDLAATLEIWRKGMIYLPGSEKVRDMIKFLLEHSKELWKGKLHWDIKRIEAKIEELNEKKEYLQEQYKELLAEDREEIGTEEAKKNESP